MGASLLKKNQTFVDTRGSAFSGNPAAFIVVMFAVPMGEQEQPATIEHVTSRTKILRLMI
jgi:hypothetical protein